MKNIELISQLMMWYKREFVFAYINIIMQPIIAIY
jgi:hypothetical protein